MLRKMPLFLKNPEWYYEDEQGFPIIKENAPEEIKKSYIDYYKIYEKTPDSKSGIIGLVIGDAIGVPIEFYDRKKLQANPVTEFLGHGSHNIPKGSWSDDSSMTLATMHSIIEKKCIDVNDIADKFVEWMENGKYTPTGKMFGIGRRTLKSLCTYESAKIKNKNIIASQFGGTLESDNGNGSLMRILPIAYYCFSQLDYSEDDEYDEEIFKIVREVSSITHSHEVNVMACYIYVKFAIELFYSKNLNQAYDYIQNLNYKYFSEECISKYKRILKNNIRELHLDEISSSGYVVDTLEATIWTLLNTDSYEHAIIKAINLGQDTDTIGACVGGLAGIYYGLDNISNNWKSELIKYDYISNLCEKFNDKLFYDWLL